MKIKFGIGQALIIAALLIMLAGALVWGGSVWNAVGDVEMGRTGWIALIMGTLFSLIIGCGLMALMFFSNRSGHDGAADPFRPHEPPTER